ncbi:hypothetical protein [Solirhodobacter olei]|uniref:hypothetical protein n=1 Tax=Solirhodobacter olei TaxID=2493082 RepID=UPI0019D47352|nr:hypothetical protein [Solirhodobacter olei]
MSKSENKHSVDEWVTGTGLRKEDYGTHSRRRTKASINYNATRNLRAVQVLLGHPKIENMVRASEFRGFLVQLQSLAATTAGESWRSSHDAAPFVQRKKNCGIVGGAALERQHPPK